MAPVRDEGVARTVGVKESIELPDLGAEEGKLMSRVPVRRCDDVLRSRLKEGMSSHAFQI
jgi:hypothetical protein